MNCPVCNVPTKVKNNYCIECGAQLGPVSRARPFSIPADSKESPQTVPSVGEYADKPIKKSGAEFGIGFAAIIIVGVGLLFAIYLYFSKTQEQAHELPPVSTVGFDRGQPFVMDLPTVATRQEDGSILLPDGLRYLDLIQGTGPTPIYGQWVTYHFVARLSTGEQLASSIGQQRPAETKIGTTSMIPGLDECLRTMRAGGKRLVTIPPWLAYGVPGQPPRIPPNATLLMEITLLEIR